MINNPPRMVVLAGRVLWLAGLTQEDLGIVISWLDDVLPGQSERDGLPSFHDPESRKALDSAPGQSVLAWAAARHAGVTYEDTCRLLADATEVEKARLWTVLMRYRRKEDIDAKR